MEDNWFSPEVLPESTLAPETTAAAPEKPDECFAVPTNNLQEGQIEDWFLKPAPGPEMSEATPKNDLQSRAGPEKVLPPPKTATSEDSDNWFAKVSENPSNNLVKNRPRKEAFMYEYVSKVLTLGNKTTPLAKCHCPFSLL